MVDNKKEKSEKSEKSEKKSLIAAIIKKGLGKGKPIKKEDRNKSIADKINFGRKRR